jgi:hypothetical protein
MSGAGSWLDRVSRHPKCEHGDPKSFIETLIQVLERKGIDYELDQGYYLKEDGGLYQATGITIPWDQFDIPDEEDVLDYMHDIIYGLGEEASFDPATCPYLEELTDRWIFVVPGWWLSDHQIYYKYVGGMKIYIIE